VVVHSRRGAPPKYGWEKLYVAVSTMATADRPLAERLAMALQELSLIREDNLPAEIWEEVKQVVAAGKSGPRSGSESVFATTTRAMNELELRDMAEKIVSCFVRITKQWD
jgi:hypothetical protein